MLKYLFLFNSVLFISPASVGIAEWFDSVNPFKISTVEIDITETISNWLNLRIRLFFGYANGINVYVIGFYSISYKYE